MEQNKTKRSPGRYEMDMCTGPLAGKIIRFSVPLMLSVILQLLFNAADVVVVGQFVGKEALAAVGSTGALVNLIVNLLIGLSVGASVQTAQEYGAGKYKDVSDTVHTSMTVSVVGGVLVGVVGVLISRTVLTWMGSPPDVIDGATTYLRIYFAGMPAAMIYNFGAAVLRAVGDTKHPMIYLTLAGVINVLLNLLFVIVFGMGVAGVAWATILSQAVSAALVIYYLTRADGCLRLDIRRLRIKKDKLIRIARIGLPAGLQGSVFSISNVIIQSSVNSFGSVVMAGNAAAGNIEGFISTATNALHQAALSFSGQNMGAKKYDRVRRVMLLCLLFVSVASLVLGFAAIAFGPSLLYLYAPDEPDVIARGMVRLRIMGATYVICAIMDVLTGGMRGMGYAMLPMLTTVVGVCGIRITWLFTVFASERTLETLYASYPISWAVTALVQAVCFFVLYRRITRRGAPSPGADLRTD